MAKDTAAANILFTMNPSKLTETNGPRGTNIQLLRCTLCKAMFLNTLSLKLHVLAHLGLKPFTCGSCETTFADEEKWTVHIDQQSHCEKCLQKFGCASAKQRHSCVHSLLSCDCSSHFGNSADYWSHLAKCELKLACRYCDDKFVDYSALMTHLKTHKGEISQVLSANDESGSAEFSESFCASPQLRKEHANEQSFSSAGDMRSHSSAKTDQSSEVEIDFSEEPVKLRLQAKCDKCNSVTYFEKVDAARGANADYLCTVCNEQTKSTISNDLLCKKCPEVFDDEGIYNDHMEAHNVHENPSPEFANAEPELKGSGKSLTCEICGDTFKTANSRRVHSYRCRKGKRGKPKVTYDHTYSSMSCLNCEKVFPSMAALEAHAKSCDKTKSRSESLVLTEYKRLHTTLNENVTDVGANGVECSKCSKVFRNAKQLDSHDKQVHRDLQCQVCGIYFCNSEDLTDHTRTHVGRKYACGICPEFRASSTAARMHRATHFGEQVQEETNKPNKFQTYYICYHCNNQFDFRKFETHCKKLVIDADGNVTGIPRKRKSKPVNPPPAKVRILMDEVSGQNAAEENSDDDYAVQNGSMDTEYGDTMGDGIAAHKYGARRDRSADSYYNARDDEGGDDEEEEYPDRGTAVNVALADSEFQNPGEGEAAMSDCEEMSLDMYETTVEMLSATKRCTVTLESSLGKLAVQAMGYCYKNKTTKANAQLRSVVREMFKMMLKGEGASPLNPHSCFACDKVFTAPQGIMNHYFCKHGSQGILLAMREAVNEDCGAKGYEQSDDDASEDDAPYDREQLAELRANFSRVLGLLVYDHDLLRGLGWPQRLVDDVLVDIIVRCDETEPCTDPEKSLLDRLRENIMKLLKVCIKEQAMHMYGWNSKPVDDVVKEILAGGEPGIGL